MVLFYLHDVQVCSNAIACATRHQECKSNDHKFTSVLPCYVALHRLLRSGHIFLWLVLANKVEFNPISDADTTMQTTPELLSWFVVTANKMEVSSVHAVHGGHHSIVHNFFG